MATIKGITIEIDGNTTGLSNALAGVNKSISSVNSELRQVNSLLKMDPGNTDLIAQKQKLLSDAIQETSSKLNTLKQAKADADKQFASGNMSEDQYRALEREVIKTEQSLKSMNNELKDSKKTAGSMDFSKLSKGLADVGKKAGQVAVEIGKVALKLSAMVGTAMAGLLTYGVKYNSEIEQLTTSFEVMTGSAEKATEITQKLKDVGAKTPYDLKGLASTTQTLMQYGMTADQAYDATLNLGDIAQGNADKMQSIALAYGQMSSAGKVNMQDIKQMINAGFNPLQAIADKTGKTMQQVTKEYEAGTISVADITEAMKFASSEGGKYYKSMEKQSKTLAGQVSSLKDNFSSLAGSLAGGVTDSIRGGVLPAINEMLTSLQTAFEEGGIEAFATQLGDSISNIITKIAEKAPEFINVAILIIQNLINGLQANLPTIVQSAITMIQTLLISLIGMLPQLLEMGIQLLIQLIIGITQALPELIPAIIDAMLLMVDTILNNLDLLIDAGIELIVALIVGLAEALPKIVEKMPEIIIKIVWALIQALPKVIEAGVQIIWSLLKGIVSSYIGFYKKIGEFISGIIEKFTGFDLIEVGKNLIKGLWNGISSVGDWIKKKIGEFVGGITKSIKEFFGIKSPSTVMRDQVGLNLGLGVAEGINKSVGTVKKAMGNLSAEVETSVNPIINPTANSNPLILQIANFNNTRTTDVQALMEEAEFYRKNTATAKGGR